MTDARVSPDLLCAWRGPSLLVTNTRGECGADQPLSGYFFREARFLRSLHLQFNGHAPWLCEAASVSPEELAFTFVYPELTVFGGGGSGQSGDEESTDEQGIRHRALALIITYVVTLTGVRIVARITNHSKREVDGEVAWNVDADFADILEAQSDSREQQAGVDATAAATDLTFAYGHPQLPYRTHINVAGPGDWTISPSRIAVRVRLEPQRPISLTLIVEPHDPAQAGTDDAGVRERFVAAWRDRLTVMTAPRSRVVEAIVAANVHDVASFAMLEGQRDEWLTLQAGVPLYTALFSRDTLTAGWQAAYLDRGESLDASLTRVGRMQSQRVDDWRDEEPGRLPYQVRRGPLARLNLNPYAAYYADFASPLMFVIALGHLYAWTGEKATLTKHWDVARRILDWARTDGDKDRDGYLEYQTRSSKGTKNQGWKDSGDAIVYDDGTPVPPPIATCEVQGYWFAAQQLMAVMSWMMGARDDARAHWRSAMALKERFNRDWWLEEDGFVALARDPEKRLVGAATSNVGHALASGIISDEHLPPVVGRLFAPDMFSGWGIRTLSTRHVSYNPLSYHLGSVWAVEQATIAFGLRRFGFDARALDLTKAVFDLAQLYPGYRIPECIGGHARGEQRTPGAYPRANTPQLWNASAFPLLVHTMLGLQPVAALELLVIDPVLPSWLPEVVLHNLRLGGATATVRFWRDGRGTSHGEIVEKRGTLRLMKQPPLESLSAGLRDRAQALLDSLMH